MGKVSIILLNYNWERFNIDCIDSILDQWYKNFEIIFVDNNSQDNSLLHVKNHYKHIIEKWLIKIIENKKNYWFAEWNNIWYLASSPDAEYVCLLNNDTVVDKDWLTELFNWLLADGRLWGVWSLVLDKWYEDALKETIFKKKQMGINNYIMEPVFRSITDEEIQKWILYTTWLWWCSYLFKKNIVNKPFPSFFFGYWEDTYLSFRILLRWYTLALCTKSIVYHFWSASFWKKTTIAKSFHWVKNQLSNILIFHSIGNIVKLIPMFLLFQMVKISISDSRIRFLWFCKWVYRCIRYRKEIECEKKKVWLDNTISYEDFLKKLSDKIFENTYSFVKVSKLKISIMHLVNRICKVYFTIFKIR